MEGQDLIKEITKCVAIPSRNYTGNLDTNGLRTSIGDEQWSYEHNQRYKGQFLQDSLHGRGKYSWNFENNQTVYEGQFYANDLEGYGKFSYNDTSVFEGLFKNNSRFGPGVFTYPDGTQDVGMWMGNNLMRLCTVVKPEWVPRLAKSPIGKVKLLKYKKLVSICNITSDRAKDILNKLDVNEDVMQQSDKLYNVHIRNPKSHFFNTTLHDNNYFCQKDCYIEVALTPEEEDYNKEEYLEKLCAEQILEEDHGSYQFLTNINNECICDDAKQIRIEQITAELEHTEQVLERMEEEIRIAKLNEHLSKLREVPKDEIRKSVGWERIEVIGGSSTTILPSIYTYDDALSLGATSRYDTEERLSGINESVLQFDQHLDYETACKMLAAAEGAQKLLLIKKDYLLDKLAYETANSDNIQVDIKQRPTKKILVSDLLAWNNQETSTEMMKHVFLHRNFEKDMTYCVADLLIGDRSEFHSAGLYEEDCILFLKSCSNGNIKEATELLWKHDLNPDLCDAKGNTGIIYAAARDKIRMIRALVNCGANVDILNDECFTPLGMCIVRYLATQHDVTDWESAFLTTTPHKNQEEQEIREWRPHASLMSISKICQTNVEKSMENLMVNRLSRQPSHARLEAISELFGSNLDVIHSNCGSISGEHHRISKLKITNDYQEPYFPLITDDNPQPYILKLDLVKPPPEKKEVEKKGKKGKKGKKDKKAAKTKKSSKASKKKDKSPKRSNKRYPERIVSKISVEIPGPSPEEILRKNKLNTIYDTISSLLKYGADPNMCEVPIPTLILAIFTKNVTLLEDLLSAKANPNVTTRDENLTPLHVLVSLPPCEELIAILKLLLNFSADPNCRTNVYHWVEQKQELLSQYVLEEEDEGKTPLHILSMRYDFTLDTNEYMNQMVSILMEHGGKVKVRYLGHTPLSLAIMRKNLKLIKLLLDTKRINPNQLLGEKMGVPLTLFILKRYKDMLPDINVCQNIIQLLLDYKANPLDPIEDMGNVIEFMIKEHEEPPKPAKKKAKKGKEKKKNKKAKSKSSGSKKSDKKGKKGKKGAKGGNVQLQVKGLLANAAKTVLEKHIKGHVVHYLYNFVDEEDYYDDISANMANFLTPEETIEIAQILIHRGEIPIDLDNTYYILYDLIEFIINIHNPPDDDDIPASTYVDIDKMLRHFDFQKIPKERGKLNLPEPEAEKHSEKYNVCFQCYQKKLRQLFICPECRVIYFCSQQCNILNNNQPNLIHKCGTIFYNEQKAIHEERLERAAHWKRFSEIRRRLPEIIKAEGWAVAEKSDEEQFGGKRFIKADPRRKLHLTRDFRSKTSKGLPDREKSLSATHKLGVSQTSIRKKSITNKDESILSLRWRKEGSQFLHWKKKHDSEERHVGGKRKHRKGKEYYSDDEDGERRDGKGRKFRSESEERRYGRRGPRSKGRGSDDSGDESGVGGKRGGAGKDGKRGRGSVGSDESRDRHGGKGGKRYGGTGKGDGEGRGGAGKGKGHGGEGKGGDRDGAGRGGGGGGKGGGGVGGGGGGGRGGGAGEGGDRGGGVGGGVGGAGGEGGGGGAGNGPGEYDGTAKGGVYGDKGELAGVGSMNFGPGGGESGYIPMPRGGRIFELQHRLPSKYQYFLEKISEYWPDFDFSMIFLPYACYSNGQLYYRFLSSRPVFMETYSSN